MSAQSVVKIPLNEVLAQIITPGLALLPARMDSDRARILLLAIGLQESRFQHRRQIGGPARGFWQFERGGGVRGVLEHPASAIAARAVCKERGVRPESPYVYTALAEDDLLACAFARLLLWTDSAPLPAPGYAAAAWDYYIRNWRPGKPHRESWDRLYRDAYEAVMHRGNNES